MHDESGLPGIVCPGHTLPVPLDYREPAWRPAGTPAVIVTSILTTRG
jgi:hypothetical protein